MSVAVTLLPGESRLRISLIGHLQTVAGDRFLAGYGDMKNASELAIEVAWFDDDMPELSLRASNPEFAGQTTFHEKFMTMSIPGISIRRSPEWPGRPGLRKAS